jgi:hypothetical protein
MYEKTQKSIGSYRDSEVPLPNVSVGKRKEEIHLELVELPEAKKNKLIHHNSWTKLIFVT